MTQVQVHRSALKRGLGVDEVIRMWVGGSDETLIDDDEPPRYMRLAFDAAMGAGRVVLRKWGSVPRDPRDASPQVNG